MYPWSYQVQRLRPPRRKALLILPAINKLKLEELSLFNEVRWKCHGRNMKKCFMKA